MIFQVLIWSRILPIFNLFALLWYHKQMEYVCLDGKLYAYLSSTPTWRWNALVNIINVVVISEIEKNKSRI